MARASSVSEPPQTLWQSLSHLGPGIILASSIVGSGELIATTIVGAEAGFVLLWLIILGCAIKVAVQVEIGRTTLTWGRTPLDAFNRVPGPRFAGLGWIYWAWVLMTALVVVQQGGVLAGVAQSLAGGLPITPAGRDWNRLHDEAADMFVAEAAVRRRGDAAEADAIQARLDTVTREMKALPAPADETIWAIITGVVTAGTVSVAVVGSSWSAGASSAAQLGISTGTTARLCGVFPIRLPPCVMSTIFPGCSVQPM
jgi:hypothetical protein